MLESIGLPRSGHSSSTREYPHVTDLSALPRKIHWFVGASFRIGKKDLEQTERFITEGIWENGYEDKHLDTVKAMQPGDNIAIKSSYTRKDPTRLPFDNHGHTVSVMDIKAIGTITRNHGDGRFVDVTWTKPETRREWYFSTGRSAIWQVTPTDWKSEGLIRFAFQNKPQDLERFRNDPQWAVRFGDAEKPLKLNFEWASFYEELATELLRYRNDRGSLLKVLAELQGKHNVLDYLTDRDEHGNHQPLIDICPFTVLGSFNRGITHANRTALAADWALALGVSKPTPVSFDAIPLVNNMNSWFFLNSGDRAQGDIDKLWDVFEAALQLADSPGESERMKFTNAYDSARILPQVKTKLSMGLFWIRPWDYLPLDGQSRAFLRSELMIDGKLENADGVRYLETIDMLLTKFDDSGYPVHSFPELSWEAFLTPSSSAGADTTEELEDSDVALPSVVPTSSYGVENIVEDGSFLSPEDLDAMLLRWRTKKNLILQGPPGTGKTWLARRLAHALIGTKDLKSSIRAVQFHPNASYEDFVRGWRPGPEGKLVLSDGPFLEMVERANTHPDTPHVLLIEEINRGNPVQIFGELLTLIEAGKRSPSEALHLAYPRASEETVHVPPNLYIIGTMNLADRSLAVMDMAFRRRFGFISLKPTINERWADWVQEKSFVSRPELSEVRRRFEALNHSIEKDPSLGPQFVLGQSFITPGNDESVSSFRDWFAIVVETEILPTLEEYWFDHPEKVSAAIEGLLG